MHPHQDRLRTADVALDQSYMLGPLGFIIKNPDVPFATEFRLDDLLALNPHQIVVAAAIGDQVADGANF